MSMCQAYGCSNKVSKCPNLGFFTIPDPEKEPERCRIWLQKIGTDKFDFKSYKYSKNRVVCEEHFEPDCVENAMSAQLGFSSRKRLKPGAIPTIFSFKKKPTKRRSSIRRSEEAQRKKIIGELLAEPGSSSSKSMLHQVPAGPSEEQPSEVKEIAGDVEPSTSEFFSDPVPFYFDEEVQSLDIAEVVDIQTGEIPPMKVLKSPVKQKHRKPLKRSPKRFIFKSPRKEKSEATKPTRSQPCQTDPPESSDFQQQFPEPDTIIHGSNPPDHAYCIQSEEMLHKSWTMPAEPADVTTEDESSSSSSSESLEFSTSSSEEDSSQTYNPSSDNSGPKEELPATLEQQYIYQSKYLVFTEHLAQLFYMIACPKCSLKTATVEEYVSGSLLYAKLYCANGHLVLDWKSQPAVKKVGVGNLLIASAILFSGNTYGRMKQFSEFLGLNFIGKSTFYRFQRQLLNPVINRQFCLQQDALIASLPDTGVKLSGDGRCDSPGYSAKFCTYSMMDMDTDKIVASNVVQVTEATSSVAMEKLGFQRCMGDLQNRNVKVNIVATDRHSGIRAAMKKDFADIDHQFDVWHMAKSIKKRIIAKGRSKECADLLPWLQAISNHLWWSAQTCGGDADLLIEKWTSLTYHITNVHEWVVGESFKRCAHPPLTDEEERSKAWLEAESPAHKALNEVLFERRLLNDIRLLNKSCHTGQIEVFHGAMLKYCPKRLHFDMPQMWARTQLAIIDHNNNTSRGQAVVKTKTKHSAKKGHKRYNLFYSKATKRWTVTPVYEPKTYGFVFQLMEDVLAVKLGNLQVEQQPSRPLARNIAPTEAPQKDYAVSMFRSRFVKNQ